MTLRIVEKSLTMKTEMRGRIIHGIVTGKLEKEDYELFVPVLEEQIERHRPIRLFLELQNFEGWTAGAFWEECKLGYRHLGKDVERIAVVGNKGWEQGMTAFIQPFTSTDVRYFDAKEREQAEKWIHEDLRAAA